MSSLERWLDDKTSEVRTREEAGFPEDVDAEIKWNKVSYYSKCLKKRDWFGFFFLNAVLVRRFFLPFFFYTIESYLFPFVLWCMSSFVSNLYSDTNFL